MTIDLSQLPPPDVIEVPDLEALEAEYFDWLAEQDPQLARLADTPADPSHHVVRLCAYRELLVKQRINDAVRSILLGTAWGTNLEHIGVPEGVERASTETETGDVVQELDEPYRARIHLAKRAVGAGVEERYKSAALAADPRVSSVYVHSPDPAEVVVEWAPAPGVEPGEANATWDEIHVIVDAAVQHAREIGDRVTTIMATIVPWSLEAVLYVAPGPDPATVRDLTEERLRAFDLSERQVRHPRTLEAIHAALQRDGAVTVALTTPDASIENPIGDAPEVYELDSVTLTVEVAPWLG